MDPQSSVAEALPALYRVVLDALAEREWRGDRAVVVRLRRQAMATYAMAWDVDTYRRLEHLLERIKRADRGAERRVTVSHPRGFRLWRRRPGEAPAR